jgi:hypothetical protein
MIVLHRNTDSLAILWAFTFAAIALLVSGCSRGPELIEVVGNVLLNGAPPAGPGSVFLAPIEDKSGSGARPAMADFDTGGKFNLSAFPGKSGIKPGRYRVSIQIWKERPQGYLKPGINLVPNDYKLDELIVDPGQKRVEVTYNILTNKS